VGEAHQAAIRTTVAREECVRLIVPGFGVGGDGGAEDELLNLGRGVAVGHEEHQVAGVRRAGATPGDGAPGVLVGGEDQPEGDDEGAVVCAGRDNWAT
jgi:hypothetical protein